MANKSQIYLLADELDHITIRYTDFNEPIKRKESADKVLYLCSAYCEIKEALKDFNLNYDSFLTLNDETIYKILVIARNVLLTDILEKV